MKCSDCDYRVKGKLGWDCKIYPHCINDKEYVDKNEKPRCKNCHWGTWTGICYKCALPRCMPKLGVYGVSKNGMEKENK